MNIPSRILTLILAGFLVSCDTGLDDTRIDEVPATPLLKSPANGSTDELDALSLMWEGVEDAATFEVQLARGPGFQLLELENFRVFGTHLDVRDLERGVEYYWRVRASNTVGVGEWSEVRSFTPTHEAVSPRRTRLLEPEHAKKGMPTEVSFSWDTVEGAGSYQLQIALDPFFTSTFASVDGIEGTRRYVYGLVKTYTYYWRVRAYNPAGYGLWSNTRYIIIEGLVDQDG